MTIKAFLKECQKWDVFKKLSIYVVTSWLLIQVLGTTWESFGLPKVANTYLLIGLILGLPFYIFYVWRVQISPYISKHVDDPNAVDIDNTYKKEFGKIYLIGLLAIGALTFLSVGTIIKNNFTSPSQNIPLITETDKIAVLKFENNTGHKEYDIIGKMAVDWLIHGITQFKAGQVVSPKIIEDYSSVLKSAFTSDQREVIEYIKPSMIISGDYYLKDGKILMQCSILDGMMRETLVSFKSSICDTDNILDCIDAQKQSALTFLIKGDSLKALNLQETPPKYQAYLYKLEAEEKYVNNPMLYYKTLQKAIAEDREYFEPKVMLISHYYNEGEYKQADSLLNRLSSVTGTFPRQLNILNAYGALLKGNNRNVFKYWGNEYNYAPFHLQTNSSLMVVALQYVNRPQAIDSLFAEIPMRDFDIDNCADCEYRYYTKAFSDIELGRLKEVVSLLEPLISRNRGLDYLKKALLVAYTRLGDLKKVDQLLEVIEIYDEHDILLNGNLTVGRELLLQQNKEAAETYLNKVIEQHGDHQESKKLALASYYLNDYGKTIAYLEKVRSQGYELSPLEKGLLAVAYLKTGKLQWSKTLIEELSKNEDDYSFGAADYALARIAMVQNEPPKAIYHLKRAVASGFQYEPETFQNDPHFLSLHQTPDFEQILTFWH